MLSFLKFLKPQHKAAEQQPAVRRKRGNFFDFGKQIQAAQLGGFTGGKIDRLTEEWNPGTIGPNRAFQMDGKRLRERARNLLDNNPHAAAAVNAYLANVIECGILPEKEGDDAWLSEWNRWGGNTVHATRHCDLARDSSISELASLVLTELVVAGGCLIHYLNVSRRSQPIPLAIELIPEERFADQLTSSGTNNKTANPVFQGIEYDRSTGRTLAYHVRKHQPNDLPHDPFETVRLSAENCEYAFLKYRPGQKRGVSLLRPVILWLWALGYYTDNELFASNVKSNWAYMIKTSEEADLEFDWPDLLDDKPESGATDIYGNLLEKHEPGMIFRGAPGDEIEGIGPNVPQSESLPWLMMIQRSIAVGLNLSYEETFRDYSKGSFSSVRAAMNSDRKRFRCLQQFMIRHFLAPTARRFDETASGALRPGFPAPGAYAAIVDERLEQISWQPPGWESVNPKDDALAEDIRLNNGTITYAEIYGRRGRDWRRDFSQRDQEERRRLELQQGDWSFSIDTASADLQETTNLGAQEE